MVVPPARSMAVEYSPPMLIHCMGGGRVVVLLTSSLRVQVQCKRAAGQLAKTKGKSLVTVQPHSVDKTLTRVMVRVGRSPRSSSTFGPFRCEYGINDFGIEVGNATLTFPTRKCACFTIGRRGELGNVIAWVRLDVVWIDYGAVGKIGERALLHIF